MRRLDDGELLARWQRCSDRDARDELLARYLPRARQAAKRFMSAGEPLDDLEQVASVGLVKALDRFDPDHGASFWAYALPTVLGELKRHLRDHCWTVRVPRRIQERSLAVQKAIAALTAVLGRSPTTAELAETLAWSREDVIESLEVGSAYDPRSLDAVLPALDGDGGSAVGDLIGAEDAGYDIAEDRVTVSTALRTLTAREVAILHLRFSEDLTQSEIAERIGISQMHVSRLIRKAVEKLRTAVAAPDDEAVLVA